MRNREGRIPALDGFRAYAILGVVSLHMLGISGVLASSADTPAGMLIWGLFGSVIDFFFIVSGFVLFLPTVTRNGDFGSGRKFALGRAARLFPAYWLTLIIVGVLVALVPLNPPVPAPDAASVIIHALGLQMPARLLDSDIVIGLGADGPTWMISVMVGFYVLLPFIARPYFRHPLIGLALAALISFGWKEAILHLGGVFQAIDSGSAPWFIERLIATDQLPGWAFSFALGMTGAWAYARAIERSSRERLRRFATIAAPFAIAAYVTFALIYGTHADAAVPQFVAITNRTDPLISLGYSASRAALMAVIVLGPLWLQRPFVNAGARRMADLSYGVYLIHVPIALFIGTALLGLPRDGTFGDFALWIAIVLPLSLGYAYLSRRFVEDPAMRWIKRGQRPWSPRAPRRLAASRLRP